MTILCATDFSPCSTVATEVATSLAQRTGEALVLLNAFEPVAHPTPWSPVAARELEPEIREAARAELATIAGKLRQMGLACDCRVVPGEPAAVIVETARALEPRLVVLGTHGRRGAARLFLGSVAEEVVRHSPCPVLVTREGGVGDILRDGSARPRLVVAADGTRASEAAFAWVAELAREIPCAITVLRIYWPAREAARLGLHERWSEVDGHRTLVDLLERELRRQMATTIAPLAPVVRLRAASRDSDETLVEEVTSLGPDALVLGVPRGPPESWTALAAAPVLRASPVPVFCVPGSPSAFAGGRAEIAQPRVVLLATDLGDAARAAVAPAYGLLRAAGGRVDICHVHERRGGTEMAGQVRPALSHADREEAQARLRSLVPPEAENLGISTDVSLLEGVNAADLILQEADRIHADVIVLGGLEHGGFDREPLGAVAGEVVRRAARPVLLVPARGRRR